MKGLAGKRVVVTGGTSGIGAATAQRFRDEGCEVVVLRAHARPGRDPLRRERPRRRSTRRSSEIGSLDVLIDNAGVSVRSPAVDIGAAQWDQVDRHQPQRRVLGGAGGRRQDAGGGGGSIVFTASTNALVGYRYYADYNASKAGLVALTRSLALEWAPARARQRRLPRLRAHADAGGRVHARDAGRRSTSASRSGRHATPEELAGLFAYLASDEAAYFTGSVIVMDGGETAGSVVSGPGGPGA